MRQLLVDNPLLLFIVAAIGFPSDSCESSARASGSARSCSSALPSAPSIPPSSCRRSSARPGAVRLHRRPEQRVDLLASLPGRGLRTNALVVGVLAVAAACVVAAQRAFGVRAPLAAGLFSGGLTNTPTLAAQLDVLRHTSGTSPDALAGRWLLAVLPLGVLGMILAIAIEARLAGVPPPTAERERPALDEAVVRVKREDVAGVPLGWVVQEHDWHASFGRIKRGARLLVATPDLRLHAGDLVTVIAPPADVAGIVSVLGERTDERIDLDRREIAYRRIFVSRPEVAGRTLRELELPRRFNAGVTRLRRGDVEFVPGPDTVIELGDRVRVLSRRANLPLVAKHLGASYPALSEIDVMSFSLGCGLGLILGLVPIPLPGGVTVGLGIAGGRLVVALILGNLGRTGSVVWTLPYNANLTLRQIGLIFFPAGIGSRAGFDFLNYLRSGGGLEVLALGAAVTTVAAGLTL